jgi:transposase
VGAALQIAEPCEAAELCAMARREKNGGVASRMMAIAHALDGVKRVAAAEMAGMDRQTLRDWVIRYHADGVAGLADLPKGHNPEKLTGEEKAILKDRILETPDPAKDGVCTWRIVDLCAFVEARFEKRVSPSGMWGILQRMGPSHQKTRPVHPKSDPDAQDAFEKRAPGGARGRQPGSSRQDDPPRLSG